MTSSWTSVVGKGLSPGPRPSPSDCSAHLALHAPVVHLGCTSDHTVDFAVMYCVHAGSISAVHAVARTHFVANHQMAADA